ncbi:hypothetical protein FISHEDRAFT_73601 [Fistulina hepatica ATCC 64428]|uniref:BTB domain-containing protein n=1 Tax=Fistulina hepatica ATCC 64428 TaxID=1128425 RepID=A0A0D7AC39_9AGAR|nr:hypothetical protein FISHEDRAFT_73601 [Fistulina hepatica ATCC 64428]
MADGDSGPRGVKRTRLDEENPSSGSSNNSAQQTRLASAKRSSAFWYSDGSLIIHASSTLFRIHRGFLAKNSSIFHDLTTFACTTDELHLDGCPVVEVSDSPEEWAELLGALYNPVYFLTTSEDHKADLITSYARLVSISTKYACAAIRAQAIRKLERYIPTSLASVPPTFGLPPFMLIGQFRKSNALMFLPYLYYVAMTETTADALWSIPNDVFSVEDKAVVFRARLNLQSRMRGTSLKYNYCSIPIIQECTCRANSHTMFLPPPLDETLFRAHVLSLHSRYSIHFIGKEQRLCANHIAVLIAAHEEGRAQAWMELPTAFGLEPWDKLQSIQDIDNQPTSSHETSDS